LNFIKVSGSAELCRSLGNNGIGGFRIKACFIELQECELIYCFQNGYNTKPPSNPPLSGKSKTNQGGKLFVAKGPLGATGAFGGPYKCRVKTTLRKFGGDLITGQHKKARKLFARAFIAPLDLAASARRGQKNRAAVVIRRPVTIIIISVVGTWGGYQRLTVIICGRFIIIYRRLFLDPGLFFFGRGVFLDPGFFFFGRGFFYFTRLGVFRISVLRGIFVRVPIYIFVLGLGKGRIRLNQRQRQYHQRHQKSCDFSRAQRAGRAQIKHLLSVSTLDNRHPDKPSLVLQNGHIRAKSRTILAQL